MQGCFLFYNLTAGMKKIINIIMLTITSGFRVLTHSSGLGAIWLQEEHFLTSLTELSLNAGMASQCDGRKLTGAPVRRTVYGLCPFLSCVQHGLASLLLWQLLCTVIWSCPDEYLSSSLPLIQSQITRVPRRFLTPQANSTSSGRQV